MPTWPTRLSDLPNARDNEAHSLTADVLNDVLCMVDIDSVKVDTRIRARVGEAVKDLRHAAARPAPVCPEVYEGDAAFIDLHGKRGGGRDT